MKSKKSWIILILGILNLVMSFIAISSLESGLPLNVWATVAKDKMCSKELLYVIPIIITVLCILQVTYRTKTMSKSVTLGKIIEDATFTLLTGMLGVANWVFIYIGHIYTNTKLINIELPIMYIIGLIIGILLIALYSTFPINKKGSIVGLRTKETLADSDVWRVANRFNGFTGFVAGILVIIMNIFFIFSSFNIVYLISTIITCILLMFYIPCLYAQMILRRKNGRIVE